MICPGDLVLVRTGEACALWPVPRLTYDDGFRPCGLLAEGDRALVIAVDGGAALLYTSRHGHLGWYTESRGRNYVVESLDVHLRHAW